MRVPYNYLPMEFSKTEKIFDVWKKLIKKSDFTLGQFVESFENKFSNYIGMRYCISTNNGTDALILSLKSLGVKKGDEVITTPISFIASAGAIAHIGAKPIFVDIENDLNINPKNIESAITKRTKAIMPVHWGGRICDMDSIVAISKKYKIPVIEDHAQTVLAKVKNKTVGVSGDFASWSFETSKHISSG